MNRKSRIYILMGITGGAILLWSVLGSFSEEAPQYDIVELGNFGRDHLEACAINDHGQIVGYFYPLNALLDGSIRPFVYDDVNGFNVLDKRINNSPWALDINNRGQVVGGNASSPVLAAGSLFIWDPESGTTENIIGETRKIVGFGKNGINNKGMIVGTIEKSDPAQYEAFVWDKERGFALLGTLGGKISVAYSINDKGQAAGWSETVEGHRRAFIWDDVNGMTDLGTLGGDSSSAFAINNRSQVVGHSSDSEGFPHIVMWDGENNVRRIGAVVGQDISSDNGIALNENGQVTGYYSKETWSWSFGKWFVKRRKQTRACPFIWSEEHGCTDIDSVLVEDLRWKRFAITDINNKGQILGRRWDHVFILQPKEGNSKSKN